MPRLLVVDDEPSILEFFTILLGEEGYDLETAPSGREAVGMVERQAYDVVITDLAMPEVDGMQVLARVKELAPETAVLMVTAFATTESAIEAMKLGAHDYIIKPFKVDEIRMIIRNALDEAQIRRERRALKRQVNRRAGFSHLIGKSEEMHRVIEIIRKIAGGKSSVLLTGESGTGKELAAKAVHENSPRADKPFVSVNCAAIPESLIESELFGYVRGAFTGAGTNKMGLFEAAHQGTIFLDEIGELDPSTQVKLLRVIQEKAIRRLGSTTSNVIDARIISASNRDLEEAIRQGRFREDLFYRLNVIHIRLPPLRNRVADIPLLAEHFLKRACEEQGKEILGFSPEALACLRAYEYPGNVRELENIIEQSVALETGNRVGLLTLPDKVSAKAPAPAHTKEDVTGLDAVLGEYEKRLILEALSASDGVKTKAAERLGISFRSLRYRLLKHGLDASEEE